MLWGVLETAPAVWCIIKNVENLLYEFIRKDKAMKNTMILTTILLLSCAITRLYAAAPGGAGGTYEPLDEATRNLEDMWLMHSLMPDALAQQLAEDWLMAGRNPAPSIEEVARYFEGEGRMFTRAILEKVRRNLILLVPVKYIRLPLSKAYQGDYESSRDALIAYLNDELMRIGAHHAVSLKLSKMNLGQLARDNPGQCVDLMHALNDIINGHQCIVTELDLRDNGLTTLPEGVFGQFGSLQKLCLNQNQLVTLPPGIFAGLTNLQHLLLSDNQLATLLPGIFAGLTNLWALSLAENQLATLPAGIFAGLTNLQQLYLIGNQLVTLPSDIFAGLTNLQGLLLNENRLTTLPAGIFAGLINLNHLSLHNNQLATLPPGIFADLTNLKILLLLGNQLPPEEQEAIRRELPIRTKIEF